MQPILSLAHVTRRFGSNLLFENLSLTLEPGTHLAVTGPSGCGKTTLLRVIAGLDVPEAGTIDIRGRTVCAADGTWVAPHLRNVGFVFQTPALWPHLTVAGNIRYGLHGLSREAADARVAALLRRFSLEGFGKRRPESLSGGEARRVSIARSLAPKPALLLLDEPLTHLDDTRREEALAFLLEEAAQSGTTLVMVTHDEGEALRLSGARLQWRSPQQTPCFLPASPGRD